LLGFTLRKPSRRVERKSHNGKCSFSTTAVESEPPSRKVAIFALVDNIHRREADIVQLLKELELLADYPELGYADHLDLVDCFRSNIGSRNDRDLEARVRQARQQFGESLPQGELNEEEKLLYTRLYGEPIAIETDNDIVTGEEIRSLFRDDGSGGLVEVEITDPPISDVEVEPDMSRIDDKSQHWTVANQFAVERAMAVAKQVGGEVVVDPSPCDNEIDARPRAHPLTTLGKFMTEPRTISLPNDAMVGPVNVILSNFSKKHITETTHRIFGGPGLPHSTSTPPKLLQQVPIPLGAAQHNMTDMEGNAFIAALYPGIYASAMSTLVEVRKRLGRDWLRSLMYREGGPRILDAGGGGAGILAWREVLKAEWSLISPDHLKTSPVSLGQSTVLTGSDALRHRASALLDNTTFLPRLPDYLHVRSGPTIEDERSPPKRKQYDVIIALHTLLPIQEDYLRNQHVQNLWSLLDPEGGVLILIEKGRQRGFEAIAGAREMILERLISSPGSTKYENLTESPDNDRLVHKDAGMIIAPCTNHSKCPMYVSPGEAKGRRDFCHFQQRYIRPPYLQRILGAKDCNHEDVRFSYIAVQRGVDQREANGVVQGTDAADAASVGFEALSGENGGISIEEGCEGKNMSSGEDVSAPLTSKMFHSFSLPRIILSPIKRQGHVILDVCTPAGKIERWTVPRSFSRQAYRDARKSDWGDLWALGAKTRVNRNLRIGGPVSGSGKDKLEKRARKNAGSQIEPDDLEDELGSDMSDTLGGDVENLDFDDTIDRLDDRSRPSMKKKEKNIPSWQKKIDKKRYRRETNDRVREK
jgi:ribosomal protein RSM22 (predicted rRNA methylase)